MSKVRTKKCPACGSYSTSQAVVTRHYRNCFWRTVDKKDPRAMREATRGLYTSIARDLDADEVFETFRDGPPDDRYVAERKLFKRANRGRSTFNTLQKQGVSKRRAAEMIFLLRNNNE